MSLAKFKGSRWFPVAVLLLSMVSIQSGAALGKTMIPITGSSGITALRLSLGTIILFAIFKPWRLRFSREERLPLIIYGLALGAMNYSFYMAIKTVPLGIAVALEFCGPLTLALVGTRRVTDFIWIILAVAGLWFLLSVDRDVNSVDLKGALLALTAGVFWAIYILAGPRAGAQHGPATVAVGSFIGMVIFVPPALIFASESLWHLSVIPAGFAIALLSSALPYSLEMIALTRLPARVFGTLMSLEPGVAALFGMILLGESLSLSQWLGLLAIVGASIGSALTA